MPLQKDIACGRSMPMNTILLHALLALLPIAGPRSLPISWCTPWKITLRSVPCMLQDAFVAQHARAVDVDDGAPRKSSSFAAIERRART